MKVIVFYSLFFLYSFTGFAQDSTVKSMFKKANSIFSSGKKSNNLSSEEVVSGLKEALSVGVKNSTNKLSAADGFFKDAAVKILMPPEAMKVENKLRALGFGNLVDNAILSMNRAAEDASKSAAPIFLDAIKRMTIQDAFNILKGSDTAATGYLRNTTTSPLMAAFRPIVDQSLGKVDATKYWKDLFTAYNRVSFNKVNPDLNAYVAGKALDGIFYYVGQEEKKIRKDPAARVTDIMKKVFAAAR